MARAQSPIAQRLKALAQRAGLPVDDRPADEQPPQPTPRDEAAPATTAADEQPTGDQPALPGADEQPTGDVPVVGAAEGVPSAGGPEAGIAPIWMDPPAEANAVEPHVIHPPFAEPRPEDVGPTELFADGPTLSPPIIPPKPLAPLVDTPLADVPLAPPTSDFPASTPEPDAADQASSMAAELGDALALPDEPEPASAPETEHEEQPTLVNPVLRAVPDPEPEPSADAARTDASTPGPDAPLPDDAAAGALDPEDERARRGLTGRLPRLLRRKAAEPAPASTPVPAEEPPVGQAPAPAVDPLPAPAPGPAHTGLLEQPLAAIPAKPSFAERAALRRRARSLRARRDAGLLELGAIVLDQRRFGDPTAGALQRRRTDELADLDNEISAIEQVIEQDAPSTAVAQLGTLRCVSCTALLGPADKFCAQCGTPRPDGPSTSGAPAAQ